MASGWIRVGSFQAAFDAIQKNRGRFTSGGITSGMSDWDTVITVYPGNLDEHRQQKTRKSKHRERGGETFFATTNMSVSVGMSMIGMDQLKATFGAITQNVRDAAKMILMESGTRIREESQDVVPYESGAMHDTWFPTNIEDAVYNDGDRFYLELGYMGTELGGVAYTWEQHENSSLKHPIRSEAGRTRSEHHFLSRPADEERARLLATAMDRMRDAIAGMGGIGVTAAADPTMARGYIGTLTSKKNLPPPRIVKPRKG